MAEPNRPSADEVAVAVDLERLAGLVPLVAAVTFVRWIGLEGRVLDEKDGQREGQGNIRHTSILPEFRHRPLTSSAEVAK